MELLSVINLNTAVVGVWTTLSTLSIIRGAQSENREMKMLGLCAYSLLVIVKELQIYVTADRDVNHLFLAVLFAIQLILCVPWPRTDTADFDFNILDHAHARHLRTKSVLTALLINLWAFAYLLFFQQHSEETKCLPRCLAIAPFLVCGTMVQRLIYYQKQFLAANPNYCASIEAVDELDEAVSASTDGTGSTASLSSSHPLEGQSATATTASAALNSTVGGVTSKKKD
jgi:hypothetical protein